MSALTPAFGWNLDADVREILSYHFMVNALRAGTIVAVAAGAVGWFMVQRRQAFAGHTLAVIGFPGAAAATWLGISPVAGYFTACIAGALVLAALPVARPTAQAAARRDESAAIGTTQAFALACGLLFVSLYHGFLSGLNSLLFGAITGVSDGQVIALLAGGVLVLAALAGLGRPLLFATVDPDVARARGVPVRLLATGFLVVLGVAAAGTSQVTGSLLVFALLVAPAAAAVRLTARPVTGLVLSVVIAVAITWLGECIAFYSPYPIGFWVSTLGFAAFVLASAGRFAADRRRQDVAC